MVELSSGIALFDCCKCYSNEDSVEHVNSDRVVY